MYERALTEFRQVKHETRERLCGDVISIERVAGIYYTVQQKWLIEAGDPYSPEMNGPPNSKLDHFTHVDSGGRAWYVPLKHEWRELPIMTEEEAVNE